MMTNKVGNVIYIDFNKRNQERDNLFDMLENLYSDMQRDCNKLYNNHIAFIFD